MNVCLTVQEKVQNDIAIIKQPKGNKSIQAPINGVTVEQMGLQPKAALKVHIKTRSRKNKEGILEEKEVNLEFKCKVIKIGSTGLGFTIKKDYGEIYDIKKDDVIKFDISKVKLPK